MPGFIQIVKNNLFNRVVNDHQVMGSLDFIQQLCVEQLYARYSTFVIHYSTLVYSRSSPNLWTAAAVGALVTHVVTPVANLQYNNTKPAFS